MNKYWQIFVISAFLVFFGISGQAAEICSHDCSKYDSSDSAHSQLDVGSDHQDASSTDDCGTSSHSHNCCSHFSMVMDKSVATVAKIVASSIQLTSYSSELIPAPYPDGPFQPPRI